MWALFGCGVLRMSSMGLRAFGALASFLGPVLWHLFRRLSFFISPCILTDCGQAYEVPIHMCDTAIPRSRSVPSRTQCHLIDMRAHVVSRRTLCVAVLNCMDAKASLFGRLLSFSFS